MTASVLTIILNWRTPAMTLRSAEAALREMEGITGEITIVDNDSGDGSFESMTKAVADNGWSRVRVLQSGHNGGFGAGNNFGIRAGLSAGTRPDYIYILNSDAFPDAHAIRALIDHLDSHPATGLAGSYIHGPDGETHTTTFRFPSILSEFEGSIRFGPVTRLLKNHRVPMTPPPVATRVDWLAGCSMMIRRSALDRIGLFDETFFLYFEETDLCLRAARAGIATDFVPASRVTHIGGETTGSKRWSRLPDYWYDSRFYYFTKNHGRAYAALATLAHLKGGTLHWLRCTLTGTRRADPPHTLRTMARHARTHLTRPERVPSAAPQPTKAA
jgi:N-acetylglucosaminyl-diphospho-decaprenol L-rhamnosyltransferase